MSRSTHNGIGANAGIERLTESERYRLLADEQRRAAIDALAGRTGPVELDDLASAVAARKTDVEPVDDVVVERIAVTLHHVHLPKMSDLGVVDYDPDTTRIESRIPR